MAIILKRVAVALLVAACGDSPEPRTPEEWAWIRQCAAAEYNMWPRSDIHECRKRVRLLFSGKPSAKIEGTD